MPTTPALTEQARIELADADAGNTRTTKSLLGSLLARLQTLQVITGAQAVGSLVTGLAAIGREASRSAEGARLRMALTQSRVAGNGEALWHTLGMDEACSSLPPAPVLDDLRNDLALLVAVDLNAVLAEIHVIEPGESIGPLREPERAECLDLVIGMWAYSREIVDIVEDLAQQAAVETVQAPDPGDLGGPVLR